MGEVVSLFGGNAFKSSDSEEKGIRWLKIANVGVDGIDWNTSSYLPHEYWKQYETYQLKKNDYVMALTRPVLNGRLKIARINLNSLLNQRVAKLHFFSDYEFGYQLLKKRGTVAMIENELAGTDPPNLGSKNLDNIHVSIPNCHSEQFQIGVFFKQLDDTITLHQGKLGALKQMKKGFLQQMFPINGEHVPRARFAHFDKEWELRKWFDTVNMSTNMVDPKTGKYDNLLHIGPGNIESFSGRILDNIKSVREDNLISGKFHFNSGDIIYGKINPQLAKYAYVNFEGLTSADTYVLKSHNGIAQDFLFVILQTKDFHKYSVSVSMRTGMPKINRDELNQYNYLAPSNIDEQRRIGTFFKQLDNAIALHQNKLEQLKILKKAYLQNMFI